MPAGRGINRPRGARPSCKRDPDHPHRDTTTQAKPPPRISPRRWFFKSMIVNKMSVLCRPGSDLLFQVLRLSTIGAGEFYGRVRDGIGYRPPANTTRPAKDR